MLSQIFHMQFRLIISYWAHYPLEWLVIYWIKSTILVARLFHFFLSDVLLMQKKMMRFLLI